MRGRPPRAGRWESGATPEARFAFFADAFQRLYGVAVDSPDLEWKVPFAKIAEGLQTIAGIGELSKKERMTVYRQKVKPGSPAALHYVIEQRRGEANPIVRHSEPWHRLNVRGPMTTTGELAFADMLAWMAKESGSRRSGPRRVMLVNGVGYEHKRRTKGVYFVPEAGRAKPDVEAALRLAEKSRGIYIPHGRVTKEMICLRFGLSRDTLNHWERGLLVDPRKEFRRYLKTSRF